MLMVGDTTIMGEPESVLETPTRPITQRSEPAMLPEPTLFDAALPIKSKRRRGARMKATDDQIRESYARTGSIYAVAEEFGMCPQSVQERLARLGIRRSKQPLSEAEKVRIRGVYSDGFETGDGKLDALAKELGRTKPFICRFARSEQLTLMARPASPAQCSKMSNVTRERWKRQPHPRGATGMKHTESTKMLMAWHSKAQWESMTPAQQMAKTRKQMENKLARYGTLCQPRQKVTWRQGWREIVGRRIYFRSRWEFNYAVYLQWLLERGQVAAWDHEPKTFKLFASNGAVRFYIPDFRVVLVGGEVEWHEVKGWKDARSLLKLRLMAKTHPDVKIRVFDGRWFKTHEPELCGLPGWEPAPPRYVAKEGRPGARVRLCQIEGGA